MSLFDEISEFIGKTFVEREIELKDKKKVFYFREMSADEAEDFFAKIDAKDAKKNKGLRNRLLAAVVCDSEGKPALTEEQAGKLPNDLANKLQDASLEANGLNKAAQDAAKKE